MSRPTRSIFVLISIVLFARQASAQTIVIDPTILDEGLAIRDERVYDTCESTGTNVSLKLSGLRLGSISEALIDSPYITCLSLDENEIEYIDDALFDRLPNLRYLNLAENKLLGEREDTFGGHENLEILILDRNYDEEKGSSGLPNQLRLTQSFPRLTHLYVRSNWLGWLKADYDKILPRLTHLYVDNNRINLRDLTADLPHTLTHLSAMFNSIKIFDVASVDYLASLILDGNHFNSIYLDSDEYGQAPYNGEEGLFLRRAWSLRSLSVTNCRISKIAKDAFNDSEALLTLDLSNNYLGSLETGVFDGLIRLRALSLSGNRLTRVPEGVPLENLTTLSLSFNRLARLPVGSFASFPGLKKLSLRQNQIDSLNLHTFQELAELEELDLADNRISRLPADWTTIAKRLCYLNANFNAVEHIDDLSLRKTLENDDERVELHLHLKNNTVVILDAPDLPANVTFYLGYLQSKSHY